MAERDKEKEERGFTVVDRRASASAEEAEARKAPEGEAGAGDLPAIDFSTFVISLGTSALYHLGLVEDPVTRQRGEKNLALARQSIDTIQMLEQKTRGNLDPEEKQLVENLLYELRIHFLEAEK